MYTSSISIKINEQKDSSVVSASQVWQQLLVKARTPMGIVPGVTKSEIVQEYADGFLRRMEIGGQVITEKITLTPEVQVLFTRVDSPGNEGFIANTLSKLDDEAILTFTGAVNFAGIKPGSAEEKEAGKKMDAGYAEAMQNVIAQAGKM